MGFLLHFWDTVSQSGTKEGLGTSEKKRLILTNRFGIISIAFTFPYIIAYFLSGYFCLSVISCFFCLIYALVPVINRFRFYLTAKFVLYFGVLMHQYILASVFGERAEIHIIYIALILLPIALFDIKKQLGWIILYIALPIIATFILYQTHFSQFAFLTFPPSVIDTLNIAYKLTTVVGCFVILFACVMISNRTERVLDNSNLFLEYQMKAIFDNSHDAIFLVDNNKREIVKVNKRAVELFEADSENVLLGKKGTDFHRNKLTDDELQKIRLSMINTGSFQDNILYKTFKGNEFWGSFALKVIKINSKNYQVVRITDITAQHEINAKLKSSLHEKEILLAEIHHRVKNNMAVISGLLGLQSTYIEDEKVKALFEECKDRIHSMALIHDKLYQHESFAKIDFCAYINDLVNHIKESYNPTASEIKFSVVCKEIYLDIKYAVPCGLILNELISNAYKHAFKGKTTGEIKIVCTKMGEKFTLMVSDDGIGFDMEAELIEPRSLGLTLIKALAEQVSGSIKTTFHDGTAFYISFEA